VSLSESDDDDETASTASKQEDDDSDTSESCSDADAGERQSDSLGLIPWSERATAAERDIGRFRRDGVPANVMVERQGDVWCLATDQEITEPWRQLFEVRMRLLDQLGLSKQDILPLAEQMEAFSELRAWWETTPRAQIQRDLICRRYKYNEEINRNWRSIVKAAMFNMFGGQLWVRIVIALGIVDKDVIRIVNDIVAERTRAREPRDPALCQGAQVRLRDESDTNRPRGVQHRVSKAKLARQAAKWYQNKVNSEREAWRQGGGCMTWVAWVQLKDEAQDPCTVVSYVCFTLPACL
jgi:hypothetical protein